MDAMNKINEVVIRYNSRFSEVRHYFGGIVADSSAHDIQNPCDKFEEMVPSDELFVTKPSHWIVKKDAYRESNGVCFNFYRGDSKTMPHVMEDGEEDEDTIDKDRIIKVPIQLKYNFLSDPIKSLNDLAGYAYSNQDLLFSGDLSHLIKCSCIRNTAPEIITCDFFNLQDTIYEKVSSMIEMIPRMTHLFIHFDIGLKKDITGCAICYYESEIVDPITDASYPVFKFPCVFGISRLRGQSTSLDHIYQFIKKLTEKYTLSVSFDTFASHGLLQRLTRDSIECKTISADRTTDPYFMFKNVVTSERCKLPYCERLLRECSELKVITNGNHIKVDHPLVSSCTDFDYKNATGEMPGSKDIADSICCSLFNCFESYSERMESGYSAAYRKEMDAIKQITKPTGKEATQKLFQGMLEDIFQ